jgi:hypothetical protein
MTVSALAEAYKLLGETFRSVPVPAQKKDGHAV